MDLYGICGAGGFGRGVMPVAQAMLSARMNPADFELVFVVRSAPTDRCVNGRRVLSEQEFFDAPADKKFFNCAIADRKLRRAICERFLAEKVEPFTIRASTAIIMDEVEVGEGAILCDYTILTSNIKIGRFFHANIYSYVEHDSIVGDFVTFAPNVHCNGHTVIEDNAYLGTGAVLREGSEQKPLVIGKDSLVGMGAVVTRDVAPGTTVIGNPAKPMGK